MDLSTSGTRLKILHLLLEKGQCTISQLSTDLGLATATVRRHLDILQRDHLVSHGQLRKGLGRPEFTFLLTEVGQETLPKEYHHLLIALLKELSSLTKEEVTDLDGNGVADLLFSRMSSQVVASYGSAEGQEARIASLVEVLSNESFLPEVERLDGALRIHLRNCPFRSVAMEQGYVCLFDKNLISGMLQSPVELQRCIRNGDQSCCYFVSLNS